MIDGEAVVLGPDGVSNFAALHSGKPNERAQLYAFDMLGGDGEDHHRQPLTLREANLDRLLSRHLNGIFMADYERGESSQILRAVSAFCASRADRARLGRLPTE